MSDSGHLCGTCPRTVLFTCLAVCVRSKHKKHPGAASLQNARGAARYCACEGGSARRTTPSQDGKVTALIVNVGGFLGIGEKDVAVPFSSVTQKMKDGKSYLTLDKRAEVSAWVCV